MFGNYPDLHLKLYIHEQVLDFFFLSLNLVYGYLTFTASDII